MSIHNHYNDCFPDEIFNRRYLETVILVKAVQRAVTSGYYRRDACVRGSGTRAMGNTQKLPPSPPAIRGDIAKQKQKQRPEEPDWHRVKR